MESLHEIVAINGLYKLISLRDIDTAIHSSLVAVYSYEIAKVFDPENVRKYYFAGLVHDIGKVGMSDEILKGSIKLSPEEKGEFTSHPCTGHEVLRSFGLSQIVLDSTLYHHERYDGSGYGRGLVGLEIPLCARILGIADTYATLTEGRKYKKRVSVQEAIEIMMKESYLFDGVILNWFASLVACSRAS